MAKQSIGVSVLDAALERLKSLYKRGDRVVVAFSTGKDSTVCLELAIRAARETNHLPVECYFADDEIIYPESEAFYERTKARPEISARRYIRSGYLFTHIFDRVNPFYYAFDKSLPPEKLMRPIPADAMDVGVEQIANLCQPFYYNTADGQILADVVGLRAAESGRRMLAIMASRSFCTKPDGWEVVKARPIYDWSDSDIWCAIKKFKWDYNRTYDWLYRENFSRKELRIGPPTLNAGSLNVLRAAARSWPDWFEKLCNRLPNVREAVHFGSEYVIPQRRGDESWKDAYQRLCIDEAPKWIADRAILAREKMLKAHANHARTAFPENETCVACPGQRMIASWKQFTKVMYTGDPCSVMTRCLRMPVVNPKNLGVING